MYNLYGKDRNDLTSVRAWLNHKQIQNANVSEVPYGERQYLSFFILQLIICFLVRLSIFAAFIKSAISYVE